jgi:hypothetical protein
MGRRVRDDEDDDIYERRPRRRRRLLGCYVTALLIWLAALVIALGKLWWNR